MEKNVALALSSGGPRGFAYIGAIEELQSRGYNITSVSGCSIGSLVGGVFAAGGLEDFKRWLFSLDNLKVMSLMDFSISKRYLVKGDKVISAIKEVVPDVNIEDLKIPYAAVAADLYTGEQVVFREGKLFDAIRASISIPSMFRPVSFGHRTLVDGGIVNTLPLDLVQRTEGDILVGFDVNDVDAGSINTFLSELYQKRQALQTIEHSGIDSIEEAVRGEIPIKQKVRMVGELSGTLAKKVYSKSTETKTLIQDARNRRIPVGSDDNYYTIISRCFSIANHVIARMNAEITPADVLVKMPFDAFSTISDYGKGEEIAAYGRRLMADALDEYEKGCR